MSATHSFLSWEKLVPIGDPAVLLAQTTSTNTYIVLSDHFHSTHKRAKEYDMYIFEFTEPKGTLLSKTIYASTLHFMYSK